LAAFLPRELHVVVTVRDMGRTIPAAWQESVRNWETHTWAQFLHAISAEDPLSIPSAANFWARQDVGHVLVTWRDLLPPDNLHVVTLPPPGHAVTELWSRFASVLGIEPWAFDASGGSINESLGVASTELLRLFNESSRARQLRWPLYADVVKEGLAKGGLSARRFQEPQLAIPESMHEWVYRQADRQRAAIAQSGADVIGDLDDLQPVLGSGVQPSDVPSSDVVVASLDATQYLVRRCGDASRLAERVDQLEHERDALEAEVVAVEQDIRSRKSRPVRQALIDSSERHASLMRARKLYWRALEMMRRISGVRTAP
jgi:hypothetical protein